MKRRKKRPSRHRQRMADQAVERHLLSRFGIDRDKCFVPETFWTMTPEEQSHLADVLLRD